MMGLITCPDCNKKVSDRAPACPNCGCPISLSKHMVTVHLYEFGLRFVTSCKATATVEYNGKNMFVISCGETNSFDLNPSATNQVVKLSCNEGKLFSLDEVIPINVDPDHDYRLDIQYCDRFGSKFKCHWVQLKN